ncbi:MAG: DUF6512 family protein [Nitrososphaeria archaeon]
MKTYRKFILKLELIGIIFIIILGSMLHFTFELSGKNLLVAIFSAVNESVWEHLKLAFWPTILYAVIEYRFLKKIVANFFFSKAVGIYLMPLSIVFLFHSYRTFLEENLVLDILIFIIAVVVGQFVSYKLMIRKSVLNIYSKFSIFALVFLATIFIIFTFYPPHLPIFQDPVTGGYGFTE